MAYILSLQPFVLIRSKTRRTLLAILSKLTISVEGFFTQAWSRGHGSYLCLVMGKEYSWSIVQYNGSLTVSFIQMEVNRTHWLFWAPLKSYIPMIAKNSVITKERKQILPIEGIILSKVTTRFDISGNDDNVLNVRRARIPLNAEILAYFEPKEINDPHNTMKSSIFHGSRRYEFFCQIKPKPIILSMASPVYINAKICSIHW